MRKDEKPEVGPGRLLVAGHPFRGFTRMIASSMEKNGVDTTVLEWIVPKRTFVDNAMRAVSKGYARRQNEEMTVANTLALERAIIELSPHYVLVMDGERLTERTKLHCKREGIKLAMWAYDSVVNFPWIADAAADYDLVFTFEPEDVKSLSKRVSAMYLPLAYDPSLYFPLPGTLEKPYDACFVGAIRKNYPERTEYLSGLTRSLPKGKIEIRSDPTPWYSPFRIQDLRIAGLGRRTRVNRRPVNHSDNNLLYNLSKISLNVHNKQSIGAVNPRTFETFGSGSMLLTDRRLQGIPDFKENRDYVVYEGLRDLIDKVRFYLENEDTLQQIAASGHSIAEEGHTFAHRAATILSRLSSL